jgi:hypothetical protein
MAGNGVSAELLAELRAAVMGPVVDPTDSGYDKAPAAWNGVCVPGYDEARAMWNGFHDRHPAVIVMVMGVADIQATLRLAQAHGITVAVRSGRHGMSGAGSVEGGLVIDLKLMRGVRVDVEAQTAVAAAGTLLGELDRETQIHGLATTSGTVSHTGIAGLTLGGGVGRLMRKHGMTCDNVLAFDIVTADGEWRHVDAEHHPDLYWALRGGGGNFGVVTHFTYQLHPIGPTVYGGYLGWPLDQAVDVYRAVADHIATVPDELWIQYILCTAPVADFIPEALRGQKALVMTATWCGEDFEEGARQIAPLRELVPPMLDLIDESPYTFLQSASDAMAVFGLRKQATFNGFIDELTEEILTAGAEQARLAPSNITFVEFGQLGGAVGRVPADATAVPAACRDARWLYVVGANTLDPALDEACNAWAFETEDVLAPFARGGRYINFFTEDDDDGMRDAFGDRVYDRLLEVKARYDPDAVFSYNPNRRAPAIS